MSELRFVGVAKHFDDVVALAPTDLHVRDGEALAVLGPSGSGKSTLLRLAAGLEAVTAGRIHLGDRDVTDVAPAERDVSMVFQGYALFPHLNVADNIGFGFAVRKVDRATAGVRIERAARLAGCDHLLDRRPDQLSGGERQRVALARAMAREPEVFLLDEPLSSLDAQRRVETRAEIHRLHRATGTTMLYVTHDQVEALTIGDRVAVLDGGRLHQVATPDEVYWQPVDRFVARFIGSPAINLVPAVMAEGALRAGPFAIPSADAITSGPPADGPLELGIRPEHLRITGPGGTDDADAQAGIQTGARAGAMIRAVAHVELVEPVGADLHLHLAAGDGADAATLVARVPSDRPVRRGDQVTVGFSPDRWYLFDAASGTTLRSPEVPARHQRDDIGPGAPA